MSTKAHHPTRAEIEMIEAELDVLVYHFGLRRYVLARPGRCWTIVSFASVRVVQFKVDIMVRQALDVIGARQARAKAARIAAVAPRDGQIRPRELKTRREAARTARAFGLA